MTNTGTVSNNADELQAIIDAQAERLRALDATIKDQERLLAIGHHLGLAYNTIPEHGDAQRLLNGEVPVLTADDAHSTVKTGASEDDHVLIEGDNLTALTMLQATHAGKVNVIYIDPPYNTGNQDFVYNDRFVDPEDSYRHSKWLSFMRARLVLARELLTNDGVIFVSIDDHEQAYLRVLMDEVFGEQNFITTFSWIASRHFIDEANVDKYIPTLGANLGKFKGTHEYVHAYGKTNAFSFGLLPSENKSITSRLTKAGNATRVLTLPAGTPCELESAGFTGSVGGPSERLKLIDDMVIKNHRLVNDTRIQGDFSSPNMFNRFFAHEEVRDHKGQRVTDIYITRIGVPYMRKENFGTIPSNTLSGFGDTSIASKELSNIVGASVFGYPKPVDLIKHLLTISTTTDSIVLDFFAGSGTTGQAVAELNKEDGGHRKCILVTNNFEQDGAENGIARGVTAVRMRRVLTGEDWADGEKHDPLPGNLRYYRIGFKALADDADVFTGAFTAPGDIAGVIALARGTHDVVSAESLAAACPVLAAAVANGRAMVLTNGHGDRVLVYSDAVAVMNGDDEYEAALAGFHEWSGDKGAVYLASLDESDDDGIVYPLPYVRIVRRTVNGLERQGLLAREK
jgi:adenine-specific DNA-methyltransferase